MLLFSRGQVGRFALVLIACTVALATLGTVNSSNARAAGETGLVSEEIARPATNDAKASTAPTQTTGFSARVRAAANWVANQGRYAYSLFLRGVEKMMDPVVSMLYKMGPIG